MTMIIPYFLSLLLGSLVGVGFLTKSLETTWIILPALIGFPGFFYLLQKQNHTFWHHYRLGFFFIFGLSITSMYWIANSFEKVGLGSFSWIASLGVPLILALLKGFVPAFSIFFRKYSPIAFAVIWSIFEWIQGHYIFTGFPWNLNGYLLGNGALGLVQYVGIYGVSFLLTLSFFFFTHRFFRLLGILILGSFFLVKIPQKSAPPSPKKTMIRLIQPCIDQKKKWKKEYREENLQKHVTLTNLKTTQSSDLIIWPEAAIPYDLTNMPLLRQELAKLLRPGTHLVIGHPRLKETGTGHSIYNSFSILDHTGTITQIYDKTHLVPFGEYMPFRSLIPFKKLTHGKLDYSKGARTHNLNVNGLSIGPSVCYEAIFPGHVRGKNRPDMLLNLTNDAWFDTSYGPYQHLKMASVRCMEEGLPMIRVANTGISAVIDSNGNLVKKLDLNQTGILETFIPAKGESTFFSKHGHLLYFIMLALGFIFLGYFQPSPRKPKLRQNGNHIKNSSTD